MLLSSIMKRPRKVWAIGVRPEEVGKQSIRIPEEVWLDIFNGFESRVPRFRVAGDETVNVWVGRGLLLRWV